MPDYAAMGPATSEDDIVVSLKPRRRRKSTNSIQTQKMRESHRLDTEIESRGRVSVDDLRRVTGYPLKRVLAHVNYIIGLGIAELERPSRKTSNRKNDREGQSLVKSKLSHSDELPEKESFFEGAVLQVRVNRYEREKNARDACLKANGFSCSVCELNFEQQYGVFARGLIHVHHRKPISLRKTSYQVDPKNDLVPVCPNCHALLHYGRPWDSPLSIDELREIIRKNREK